MLQFYTALIEDILGHEGSSQTTRLYAEETELELKLDALKLLTPMTAHLEKSCGNSLR